MEVMRPYRKRSKVWDYFTTFDRDRVKCKFCPILISYKGSTTNLQRHLRNKHCLQQQSFRRPIVTTRRFLSEYGKHFFFFNFITYFFLTVKFFQIDFFFYRK